MKKFDGAFTCKKCMGLGVYDENSKVGEGNEGGFVLGEGTKLKVVDKFCYLGYFLDIKGGVDRAVKKGIGERWNRFHAMKELLTRKGISLKLKGR